MAFSSKGDSTNWFLYLNLLSLVTKLFKCNRANTVGRISTNMGVAGPFLKNQSSERPVRSFQKFKAFKPIKILLFFLWFTIDRTDSKITQNSAISKHFTKPTVYIRTTSGTIFSADVCISGGHVIFQYKSGV